MFATATIFVIFYEISFVVEFGKIISLGSEWEYRICLENLELLARLVMSYEEKA